MFTKTQNKKETSLTWLTLFITASTLVCCALPIILVALGLGSILALLVNSAPFLVTLSLHKAWVFIVSCVLLAFSGWFMYRPGRACPADPELGALCDKTQVWNRRVFWFSVAVWSIGFFAAYLALPLQLWIE